MTDATDTAIITRHRPATFDEIIGQRTIVESIKGVLEKKRSKAFLFGGPSGTGKTTLARICAREVGCQDRDLLEVDAATYTGIEAMRDLTSGLQYKPVGSGVKAIILDECHALSSAAFKSLLKITEEPPPWVYWFFCTSEPSRVPVALQRRCVRYELRLVKVSVMSEWLASICRQEGIKVGEDIIELCCEEARGSPGQALANLAACETARSYDAAARLLKAVVKSDDVINLARAILRNAAWPELMKIVEGLKDTNPESIRYVVQAYLAKVALGAKDDKRAGAILTKLDPFTQPFPAGDALGSLIIAVGRAVFG